MYGNTCCNNFGDVLSVVGGEFSRSLLKLAKSVEQNISEDVRISRITILNVMYPGLQRGLPACKIGLKVCTFSVSRFKSIS